MKSKIKRAAVVAADRLERCRSALAAAPGVGVMLAGAGIASATTTATYDITPVTTGFTSDLAANIPLILGTVGAIIALTVGVHLFRKFAK